MNTREKVIEALEKEKGAYVSGEMLAKTCNVSRNAIWKSINELRKIGYPIKSVNNRGYMLDEHSDIISKAGICMYLERLLQEESALLSENDPDAEDLTRAADRSADSSVSNPFSAKIFVYEELDSTNNEARRALLFYNGRMLHGTVFVAKQQTSGRGHHSSSFSSPAGGIYLSILLEPEKVRVKDVSVTEMIANAVKSILERHYHVAAVKEKDSSIFVEGKKVCGILTEGVSDLETGSYSNYIVGIGIRDRELQVLGGVSPQRNEIIAEIIKALC